VNFDNQASIKLIKSVSNPLNPCTIINKKALKQTFQFILTLFVADGYRLNSRLN
jgi:hypothetical protein